MSPTHQPSTATPNFNSEASCILSEKAGPGCPARTLCCAFNDSRKVQELDVGSFVLGCRREDGKVRMGHWAGPA